MSAVRRHDRPQRDARQSWRCVSVALVRNRSLADPIGGRAALVALLLHEGFAVELFGFVLIVRAAAQSQVLDGAAAAEGDGAHVVVFE